MMGFPSPFGRGCPEGVGEGSVQWNIDRNMDRIIYTAMNGAMRTLEHQAALSNNMANVNTPGFREQLALYRSVPITGDGSLPTRVTTVASTPGSNMQPGSLQTTGRELDVAVAGDAWLAVQTAQGEAYTRAGSLHVGADGVLQTAQGLPVLSSDGAAIEVPERAALTFSSDGNITALGAGDRPNDIQQLGQLKLADASQAKLIRGDDGLYRPQDANGQVSKTPLPVLEGARMVSGALEGSNVSASEAMVGMINNARRFEMQMKVVQQADQNAQRANSILSASV